MADRVCPCGKPFSIPDDRVKWDVGKFCSKRCAGNALIVRVTVACVICGASISRTPSKLRHAKSGKYTCSIPCRAKAHSSGLVPHIHTKPMRPCTPEQKEAQRARGRAFLGTKRVFYWTDCMQCGKRFNDEKRRRQRNKSGLKFCSLPCCNNYRKGPNNPRWVGGRVPYYGPDWNGVRYRCRVRDGHQCVRCKKPKGEREHDVHHLKPVNIFENANDANTMDNVVTLCSTCHRFTEDYGVDFQLPEGVKLWLAYTPVARKRSA